VLPAEVWFIENMDYTAMACGAPIATAAAIYAAFRGQTARVVQDRLAASIV